MWRMTAALAGLGLLISVSGAADRTLNFPITFQNGLYGYFTVEAQNVGSTPRNETSAGGSVWVNNLFGIQLTQTLTDGRNVADFQITSSSTKPLAVSAVRSEERRVGKEW